MTNGTNNYGVTFPQIKWIERVLKNHPKVFNVIRSLDIQFEVSRLRGDNLRLICLNEYACGIARVYEVLEDFPDTKIIYVGGNWNNYTMEAKEFCLSSKIGLFKSSEINGALHQDEFWTYHRRD